MIRVTLDHVALDVADRNRSAAFYRDLLGAEIVAEDPQNRLTFLRLPGSGRYSDIALHEHDDVAGAYPPDRVRMAHTGWRVADEESLVRGFDFFTQRSQVLLAADFGVARSVMGLDPDGHVVELELFAVGALDQEPGFAPLDVDALRGLVAHP